MIPSNKTANISISEIQNELEKPFLEKDLKEFREKKAQMLAFLTEKLQLTEAEEFVRNGGELNDYQRLKNYFRKHYDFKYDIVGNNLYMSPKGKKEFTIVNEKKLTNELFENGFTKFSDKLEAILQSEIIAKFDIFVDYFFNLPEWNPNKPDYIGQLANYVQTTNNELFKHHLKKHLIRSVACSLTYIDFNKHCLVFYGKQNDGKSYLVRFLCPPLLPIKENLDMQNKDARFALARYFIINLDEMQALQKTDVDKIKNYITTNKISDRLPYDKRDSIFPRRANFYGTTNNEEILTDTTGNVRFLIFEILGINHDNGGANGYKGNIDINNVYAQAFYYFITGKRNDYELTKEEIEVMEKSNRKYMTVTPEMDLVPKYLTLPNGNETNIEYLRATEILRYIEKNEGIKLGIKKLGQSLKYYGFKKQAVYTNFDRGDKYAVICNIIKE